MADHRVGISGTLRTLGVLIASIAIYLAAVDVVDSINNTVRPTSIVLIKVQDSVKKSSIVGQGFGLPELMSPVQNQKSKHSVQWVY
jgi:hypothetical protein